MTPVALKWFGDDPQITQITQMWTLKPERDPQTYAVLGAAMRVHRELGSGFLEPVYQEALEVELGFRGIPFARQVPFALRYRGQPLKSSYRADLICYSNLIVELKALRTLSPLDEAQVINYLKASGLSKSLLINFGGASLQHRRLVLRFEQSASSA